MTVNGDASAGALGDEVPGGSAGDVGGAGGTARRELRLAVLLGLLGSGLVLLAVRQTWLSIASGDSLTIDAVRTTVRGSSVSDFAQPGGLVGIAGVLAIAATRRLGRVVVGALVLAAAVAVVIDVLGILTAGVVATAVSNAAEGSCASGLRDGAQQCLSSFRDAQESTLWPLLTVVGAVALAAAGLLVAIRGRRWAALSSSYQPPVAREKAAPVTDKGVWDALDRGDDPTA